MKILQLKKGKKVNSMKIEKINNYRHRLLKLKLIKNKLYKDAFSLSNTLRVEDTEYRLKKALNVVHKYHHSQKRILFIGNSIELTKKKKLKKILKKTKHIFVPEVLWVEGLLANQKSCFKYLSKNYKFVNEAVSKTIIKLKGLIDLIVIASDSFKSSIIKESYKKKIPVIVLGDKIKSSHAQPSYYVPGSFQFTDKKIKHHLFYSLISSVLSHDNESYSNYLKAKYCRRAFWRNIRYQNRIREQRRKMRKEFFKNKGSYKKKVPSYYYKTPQQKDFGRSNIVEKKIPKKPAVGYVMIPAQGKHKTVQRMFRLKNAESIKPQQNFVNRPKPVREKFKKKSNELIKTGQNPAKLSGKKNFVKSGNDDVGFRKKDT